MNPTILTADGSYYNFLEPESCPIKITTIAHALSNICRFTGHTNHFYSVAQHSVLVSHLVPPEHAMAGLLHDAAEAFLGDVSSPLKVLLPDYKAIEARVEAAIFSAFGLPATLPIEVKQADLLALAIEQRDLLPKHADIWECELNPGFYRGVANEPIIPVTPLGARLCFLARFEELLVLDLDKHQANIAALEAERDSLRNSLDAMKLVNAGYKAERDALKADAAKNENTLHIGQQVNRACQQLPINWRLVIDIELDAGTVSLVNPDGDFVAFGDSFDGFSYEISEAIDAAIETQKGSV